MKGWIEKTKEYFCECKKVGKEFFFFCYLPSLCCCVFVELCSRRSVIDLFLYLLQSPFVFLYNAFIIATVASVCLLFRKRSFVLAVVMLLWATIGVTDMVLLSFRTTPFTAVDLLLIKSAFAVMNRYMTPLHIILVIIAAVAAIVGLVVLFRKAKRVEGKLNYYVRVPVCAILVFAALTLSDVGMATGLLDRNFGNLAQAFHDNGLPWCFMNSVLNTGVDRPNDYSPEEMDEILGKLTPSPYPEPTKPTETAEPSGMPNVTDVPQITPAPEITSPDGETAGGEVTEPSEYPNIIFLQLESFFDPKYIWNSSYTMDPVPFFTYLRENYPSGFLSVPSIGAGTANTEFECIAGMNLDLFGPGEYPYKTILSERTCESVPYSLKNLGYTTSAIHNNDGTFYGRNEVFANLGFDRFVSQEYMENVEFNELNWMKDHVLTNEIMKILRASRGQDYIYAISVQGHGAYPEERLSENEVVDVQLPEELADYYYQYLYYVNQLYEMDMFLRELVLTLTAYPEEVVLVMYGDHLPSIGLREELLTNGDLFQTEYIIWSNFELAAEDKDLQAYQLGAHVCDVLDLHEGIMIQFHQKESASEDYLENMQLLMYDMLYGEMEVYGGVNPYEPTELKMGIEDIVIEHVYVKKTQVTKNEPILYITGDNFTEWSYIAINGEEIRTIYLNQNLLAATELPDIEAEDGICYFSVRQHGSDEIVLSETAKYAYEWE